jgi:hypothetical protein
MKRANLGYVTRSLGFDVSKRAGGTAPTSDPQTMLPAKEAEATKEDPGRRTYLCTPL